MTHKIKRLRIIQNSPLSIVGCACHGIHVRNEKEGEGEDQRCEADRAFFNMLFSKCFPAVDEIEWQRGPGYAAAHREIQELPLRPVRYAPDSPNYAPCSPSGPHVPAIVDLSEE